MWRIAERDGKKVKLPIDYRTGALGNAHDRAQWMSAEVAFRYAESYGVECGVGFVVTKDDPFYFLDIDNCLKGDNWSPLALEIIAMLPGAAIEVSQSGRGLHLFGSYSSLPEHSKKNIALGLELYTADRFVALTFDRMQGCVATDCTIPLNSLIAQYFPPKAETSPLEWTDKPVDEWDGIEDNAELIERAKKSKSGKTTFGGGVDFKALWEAQSDVLGKQYPDPNREYDASSADMALAQHLAFWTGNNCARMWDLIWQSALRREKWEQRIDYVQHTILVACSQQTKWYKKRKKIESVPVTTLEDKVKSELRIGYQWLSPPMQLEYFRGCCYIQDLHAIFIPSGNILKKDQFNVVYGGYSFQMDDTGKASSKNAFEAFTQSQAATFPKAESTCFRPQLDPGALINEDGRILINSYVPIKTRTVIGDPTPFQTHLAKILPDRHDQEILLAYMAACLQHKGIKFQWAPLLQGTYGNGKTLFSRCLCYAVGSRYMHMPRTNEISEKFNAWLFDKLFIGIEEMHVPEHRKEILEILSTMITNTPLAMRGMNQSEVMKDNYANFMFNSNWKDATQKTRNDRRFCVFLTAQQSVDDLERDGMQGDYFPKLYDWLKADGYAIVSEYLQTYSIPDELNPATACQRAPVTSTTDAAITASLGGIEQEIMEAIEQARPGFAGGWISSTAFSNLLDELRMRRLIPRNRRREILQSLGYDWHPNLKEGRVNNKLKDGTRPQLYILAGHVARNFELSPDISRAFENAQAGAAIITPSITQVLRET